MVKTCENKPLKIISKIADANVKQMLQVILSLILETS